MGTLLEDIKKQSDWTVKAFKFDGIELDFSIGSLIEIDRFIQKYTKDGQPIKGGRLFKNFGGTIFSIGSYIGETLIKNVNDSKWITDESDPNGEVNIEIKFADGTSCWPIQRLMQRIQNGLEDGIYPYGVEITNKKSDKKFDNSFWKIETEVQPMEPKKPWWKF